jgi:hypothetical protein
LTHVLPKGVADYGLEIQIPWLLKWGLQLDRPEYTLGYCIPKNGLQTGKNYYVFDYHIPQRGLQLDGLGNALGFSIPEEVTDQEKEFAMSLVNVYPKRVTVRQTMLRLRPPYSQRDCRLRKIIIMSLVTVLL